MALVIEILQFTQIQSLPKQTHQKTSFTQFAVEDVPAEGLGSMV